MTDLDKRGQTQNRSIRFMTALMGALIAAAIAICALTGISLVRSRAYYLSRAETETRNLCAALAGDLVSSYEKIDLAILSVKDEMERQLQLGRLDNPRKELIKHQRAHIPVLFGLRIADANGLVTHRYDMSPGTQVSLADRDYFVRLKADPSAGLVISRPAVGRVTGKWRVMFARRINRPDGSFYGVAYGGIELEKLGQRFASLSIGTDGAISLRDADLAVIIRRGGKTDLTGSTLVPPEYRKAIRDGRSGGTFTARAQVDGVVRIYSFVALQPYGHNLLVGFGKQEVLRPWRREFAQTVSFAASFLVLIAAATFLAYQAWRRQLRAEAEREHLILELQHALAEVKTLSGLLPICSYCKKIRDDQGYWNQIEAHLATHADAQFTHGICPDCAKQFFPEVVDKREPESR